MAARVEFEDDNGRVVRYVRHANGGGLVSPEARVQEGAMVASTAYVEAGAQVGDRSRIGAGRWLDLVVIVGEDVVVAGNVHLGPRTRVEDGTWIGTGARVTLSSCCAASTTRVAPTATLLGRGQTSCAWGCCAASGPWSPIGSHPCPGSDAHSDAQGSGCRPRPGPSRCAAAGRPAQPPSVRRCGPGSIGDRLPIGQRDDQRRR